LAVGVELEALGWLDYLGNGMKAPRLLRRILK
jgi:hypothetical protein